MQTKNFNGVSQVVAICKPTFNQKRKYRSPMTGKNMMRKIRHCYPRGRTFVKMAKLGWIDE